jgi:hypothetical protein
MQHRYKFIAGGTECPANNPNWQGATHSLPEIDALADKYI